MFSYLKKLMPLEITYKKKPQKPCSKLKKNVYIIYLLRIFDKHIITETIPCHKKHFPKQKLSFINSCFTCFRKTSYKGYVKYADEFK